ncbi:bifunctional adenosylcobinamide kinase/adenosylcobinamide-phosphate guanylyltransferase [Desulfovibrio sp. ZJ369]|uniref:bifunctional adenosylcobinamide kinase/adenosylcobinamide-phosphate guanylyltransferase n=1 Tax=Desulfovibrio sp. ZJ369 TaxID=2709793 RepID=UPI0013EC76C8|nr:bifunctional adenosylcobinamide kinase/adenosylcobinamide-phosphate guanylyltransferase [Desulfovibrio sp. ZJ369]
MSRSALLFVGGTRSGKSGLAQRWAEARACRRLFLATCRAQDAEMAERVARHQAQRGVGWQCLEEPLDPLAAVRDFLEQRAAASEPLPGVLLLDCVSIWLANLLASDFAPDAALERVAALAAWLETPGLPTAVVSAETGLGIVPGTALGRLYRDVLGSANQMLARACPRVIFVSCGLPLALKGPLPEEIC